MEEASDSRAESGASCDQPDRRHILFEHGILRFEAQLFRAAFPQAPGIGSSAVFAVLHDGHRAHRFPGAAHERVCLCRRYLLIYGAANFVYALYRDGQARQRYIEP